MLCAKEMYAHFGVIMMTKIEDCKYMELYDVECFDLESIGSKAVLVLYLANDHVIRKKIHIAISNIFKVLETFGIKAIHQLNGQMIRCLINPYQEVNYITPMRESDWLICKEVHYNGRP